MVSTSDTTSMVSTSDTTSMVPTNDTTSMVSISDTTSIVSTSDITTVTPTTSMVTNTVTATVAGNSSDGDGGPSVGIIAGAVVGVIFCTTVLLLVVTLLWCFSRRRKGKPNITTQGERFVMHVAIPYPAKNYHITLLSYITNFFLHIQIFSLKVLLYL